MNVRSGKRGAVLQTASARSAWGWGARRLADAREADRMSAPLGCRRNLQPRGAKAKPYQVKQVRDVIVWYGLAGEDDEQDA